MTPTQAGAQPAVDPRGRPAPAVRLRWGATISGAIVVTLIRPRLWAVGLAGYLAGGGLLLVTLPVLVLPTPTGLQNALGTPVSSLVFGAPSAALVELLVQGFVAAIALLTAGLLTGAWAERQGIGIALDAAAEEGIIVPAPDLDGAPGTLRIAALRLLSLAPVMAAALVAWRPVYDVTYRELTLPGDLSVPLPVRVLGQVPWVLVGFGVTWLLADAAAAVGVRRLVLERRPVLVAWLLGWADLVRRPHRILPTALVCVGVTLLIAGPPLAAAAAGWAQVRDLLVSGDEPAAVVAAVIVWVAVWLGALVLAGVAAAFRSAAWSLELPRRGHDARYDPS
jgi:hypothetical protein